MPGIGLIASITLNVIAITYLLIKAKRKRRQQQHQKKTVVKTASNVRTISCPACSQHIKFTLPLSGNKAICRKCSAHFKLDVDEHRNIYITEIKPAEDEQNLKSLEECYLVLEVTADAIPMDIKAAYKKKISEYHPDRVENLGTKIKQVARDETRKINIAYAMLQESGRV